MARRFTANELRTQLEALLAGKTPDLVALATEAAFEPEELECGGRRYRVCRARSVLEFYDLVERAADQPLLVLTELSDRDLGTDLRCRLYKRRILSVDPWQTVKHLFDCRGVEAALIDQPHLARYLLLSQPVEGYSKVKGEVLTADKAWSCLFTHRLEMPSHHLDSLALLEWAHRGGRAYLEAPEDLKGSARDRVIQICGELGAAVLDLLENGSFSPLALGLALRCLVSEKAPRGLQREALVRLERYLGGRSLDPKTVRDWAQAAEHLVFSARAEHSLGERLLNQADEVLAALQAQSLAVRSTLLPHGLSLRFEALAAALDEAFPAGREAPADPGLTALDERSQPPSWSLGPTLQKKVQGALDRCAEHKGLGTAHGEALRMLPRLMRWLATPEPDSPGPLDGAAQRYARDSAFADWAWLRSQGRLTHPALERALSRLFGLVEQRLERVARTFVAALAAWNQAGEPQCRGLWRVEDLIPKVLEPIAAVKGGRFLLVVLDGCAWPTLHELLESMGSSSWTSLAPEGVEELPGLLATYPCLTEGSRASLLSGRPTVGDSAKEKESFRQHPGLRQACNPSRPPVLFHKGELGSRRDVLPTAVRDKIADTSSKAVAVVLNAIDDHLERSDQLEFPWHLDTITHLSALLTEAHSAGRLVVLASDHGHLLERDGLLQRPAPVADSSPQDGESSLLELPSTPAVSSRGGARWRLPGPKGAEPAPGEVVLSGPRALVPGQKVVLSWSSRLRYTRKKHGYHGGAHPREMLAPLWILAPFSTQAPSRRGLPGWRETHLPKPDWWYSPNQRTEASRPDPVKEELLQRVGDLEKEDRSGQLFLPEVNPRPSSLAQGIMKLPQVSEAWSGHRGQVDTDWALRLLQELENSGCQVPLAELSDRLEVPEARFRELLAEAADLFAVDGRYLVTLTPDAGSVQLDRSALEALTSEPQTSRIQVQGSDGSSVDFSVPVAKLEPRERQILEALARHRELSESELKKILDTRRGGQVEKLMERLAQAGFTVLKQSGEGPEGRIYRLELH